MDPMREPRKLSDDPALPLRPRPSPQAPGTLIRRVATLLAIVLFLLPACSAKKDFQKASEEDTIQAYQSYLEKHGGKDKNNKYEKRYVSRAEKRLEELTYDETCRQDDFEAYQAFLEKYPVGKFSREAERRGEDRRAEELGIHLYRSLPADYYEKVNTRSLPYRTLVRASSLQGPPSQELATTWYEDLVRMDLFVPMDPDEAYPVSPDITLDVRQAVVYLCVRPRAYVEAEAWARGKRIKNYRVAADNGLKALLYEIFCDRELFDKVLGIPDEEKRIVRERFTDLERRLPKSGSVALEMEVRQDTYPWDQEISVGFAEFLGQLHPYETFASYLRGQPPDRSFHQRVFFRVDPQIHSPYVRTNWSSIGPTLEWQAYNSKWIETEKEYFFRKMTLDLVDFLAETASSSGRRSLGGVIYVR